MTSSRPRIAVVGAGWWATTWHLPSLASYEGAELVAVCDARSARARAAADRFGVPLAATDLASLLASTRVDGVVVATPHTTHYTLARTALDAGVHVFVEKPLTTTAAEAWDLVERAEANGLHLSVGYTYQYTRTAQFVRHAVQERIGSLVCVAAQFTSSTLRLFAGGEDSDDPATPHPTTYADPQLSGGGQGHTQVTHLMGTVLWATGREVEEVSCYMDNRGCAVDVVDVMAFRFAGGGMGTVTSTGTALGQQPPRQRIQYFGTEGLVEQDLLSARAVLHRNDGTVVEQALGDAEPTYPADAPARAFADLIAGRGPNHAPGRDAAATVAFLDAAYRSAASRRPEPVLRRHERQRVET
jgi:predicted dehydrogenase